MITRILAASVLTIGLATSAMAQSSGVYTSHTRHRPVEQTMTVDPNTTGSITTNHDASGLNTMGSGAMGPCASNTPGPDANADSGVNDHYCGK